MQYFIGLTFAPHFIQFKKIDSFRRRFDYKYYRNNVLQMTLIPPFDVAGLRMGERVELWEAIEDELDTHLRIQASDCLIQFRKLDFYAHKKAVVYLRPELSMEWEYCLEGLGQVLKEFNVKFIKTEYLKKCPKREVFLPLGRLENLELLDYVIEQAKLEFTTPFAIEAKHVFLFEKRPGEWPIERKLHTLVMPKRSHTEDVSAILRPGQDILFSS